MAEINMLAIAEKFALEGTITEIKALGDGFINDTFIVKTEGNTPNYILQRKNHQIFPDVPGMMDNIQRVTTHIKAKVAAEGGDPMREVLTIVKRNPESISAQEAGLAYNAHYFMLLEGIAYAVNGLYLTGRSKKRSVQIGNFQKCHKIPLFSKTPVASGQRRPASRPQVDSATERCN